jgi:hypothetical protein
MATSQTGIELFYRSPMHYSPRNVWYRLIHKKLSSRTRLFDMKLDWIDTDQCSMCMLPDDDKHLLFSCEHKADIWHRIFKTYIGSPTTVYLHQIYCNIATLKLSLYSLLSLDLKVLIFNIFATTMRFI